MRELWWRRPGSYKGYQLHCAPGTQEGALALLMRHRPAGGSVLDVASGSGAILARLRDFGFRDLEAVVRDPEVCGHCPETWGDDVIPRAKLDLNGTFSEHYRRRFSLVISSEVIEHVDSPRAFLAELSSLLEDRGHLLVTTPNVANWIGRIRFLVYGELRWFDRDGARRLRHISPLTDAQAEAMFEELGFEVLATTTAGSFNGPLRALACAPLSLLFRIVFGRRAWGDCSIYLCRKVATPPPEGESTDY